MVFYSELAGRCLFPLCPGPVAPGTCHTRNMTGQGAGGAVNIFVTWGKSSLGQWERWHCSYGRGPIMSKIDAHLSFVLGTGNLKVTCDTVEIGFLAGNPITSNNVFTSY